jgi:hypothetical protein
MGNPDLPEESGITSPYSRPYKVEDQADQWQDILGSLPFREGLAVVDDVLSRNDYEMTTHLSGQGYWEVALRGSPRPSGIHLRIDEELDDIREKVENQFFQEMEPETDFQPEEFPYMSFSVGSDYQETYHIPLDLDHLEVRYPSRREFYVDHVPHALEESDLAPEDTI